MTWPPPYETHPLDRAWAALDPAVQRQQASAEARAFYRQPCREYRSVDADEAVAALVEAVINRAVDDICPPLPGRPKRGET